MGEPRDTIDDKDWQDLRARADKANPDMWRITDEKGTAHRKIAKENYKNRDKN